MRMRSVHGHRVSADHQGVKAKGQPYETIQYLSLLLHLLDEPSTRDTQEQRKQCGSDQHKARFSERSKTAQKQSQLSTNSEKNFRSIQSGKPGYGPRRVGHGGLQGPVLGHLQKHLHREHTAVRGQDLPHGLGYSNKQAASSGGLNGNTRGVQNHRKRSEIWGKYPFIRLLRCDGHSALCLDPSKRTMSGINC